MCGRYSLKSDPSKIAKEFNLPEQETQKIKPHYNIAPSQPVVALVREQTVKLEFLNWGLVPSWSKDPSIGSRMINARQETLAEKPSFRGLLKSRRCLVLADGFYEWKAVGKRKQPHYIRLKSQDPFGFASLWSEWMSPDGSEIRSCTIITTEPNDLMREIHSRMPVILPRRARDAWLDPSIAQKEELLDLLKPYSAEEMEAFPVSTFVNSPANDTSACFRPTS